MEGTIRLFVAAALPDDLGPYLQEKAKHFEDESLRQMPLQNLHLTLFFIGNVPMADLNPIRQQVKQIASQNTAFTLALQAIEQGPKHNSPRLVWARFAANPAFETISRQLQQVLNPKEPNKQKPIPHITLARYRKNAAKPTPQQAILPDDQVLLPVRAISLWRSELASPHPIYSVLETYALQPKL